MLSFPTAWSYSNWEVYDRCPFQYHGRKVLKQPEPVSDSLQAGRDFHTQIAHFITLPDAPVPERPVHDRIKPIVLQLRDTEDKVVEQQWAFTRQWKPTGWFAKQPKAAWLRVILDVGVVYPDKTAIVGDWKTGRRYDSNDDQMELFALAIFAHSPWVEEADTRLWYVDGGEEICKGFKITEAPALAAKWEERAERMLADREFVAKPNDKCKFCIRARSGGGDCKFG